ncbi:glycosyltransferase [Acinetobacter pseudolwoffii]|uniref:glycosyltransferase n=1 Tax=Acinetobacter pseudolwoffii TaxID=2053287 RepID=UPI0021E360B2|nr:glycosyltransferase [Acinetobacter pseudolwoffii]
MKLMIDASICSKGGGIQVALSFLENIAFDSDFELVCVVNPEIDKQLSIAAKNRIKSYYVECIEPIYKKNAQGKRISKIEKKHAPDLVFVVFGPSYWRPKAPCLQGFALPLMIYEGVRNYVYKHNLKLKLYQKLLNYFKARKFKKNADFAVVETQTFKKRLSSFMNFDESKIFVVENSFNSNFLIEDKIEESKQIQSKILNLFVPSAFYPHKNLNILVDVAYFLKNEFKITFKFNFLIKKDSLEWQNLTTLAKSKSVDDCFYTYGAVPNAKMKHLYAINNFIILPTLAEASTAVYPEAFISKKVLLTSDIDFARELCGNAAIFFDPLDAHDIAEKIININSDIQKQSQLIQRGLERLKSVYLSPEEKWLKQRNMLLNLIGSLK